MVSWQKTASPFSLFFFLTVSKHVLCGSIFTCVSPCTLISVFTSATRYEPFSALANDGQLKAHSQDSNQIYSLLIGLEEAGGRAFISVFLSLFVLLFCCSCALACMPGWLAAVWVMDKRRSCQRSWGFEPSQRGPDPLLCCRGMAAAVNCNGWQCFVCRVRICPQTSWMRGCFPLMTQRVESKKAGQRVKHHLARSRTASASILL